VSHWRLAARYAVWVAVGAAAVGGVIWLRYGESHAGAFGYGSAVGLASFVSTALSVSLVTGRSAALRAVGAASFVGRYLCVAGALGAPAYMGLWPVVAMLGGFAGVYLAENFVLLPGVFRVMSSPGAGREGPERERVERRVAA
jgi:hypothetical protein